MPGFIPIGYFAFINLVMIIAGYRLLRKKQVALSWVMLIAGIVIIYVIFQDEKPIVKMLAIIATTFTGMKVVAATVTYKNKADILSVKQWAAFVIGWAGMRAQPFETLGAPALPGAWRMIGFGISRILAGLALIFLAHVLVKFGTGEILNHVLISALLLVGLSLILHFGLLNIGAGSWRLSGVNTYYLFREPAKAISLTEFWSKRWNLAFSEMTSITLFRPIKNRFGSSTALIAAFIFSGSLHELALSLPVNSGYGLPMLYFILQGVLVLVEKSVLGNSIILRNKILARIWIFFWLVVPAPLLFHAQFIQQIVWPLCGLHYH